MYDGKAKDKPHGPKTKDQIRRTGGQGLVVKPNWEKLRELAVRCVRLQCPSCGQSSIVERPFHIRHHCRSCNSLFKREEGFFVGAILANVVITELIVLAVCFFCLIVLGFEYETVLWLLFTLAIIFPIAFFHHSWSCWLGLDYLVEDLPKYRESPTRRGIN